MVHHLSRAPARTERLSGRTVKEFRSRPPIRHGLMISCHTRSRLCLVRIAEQPVMMNGTSKMSGTAGDSSQSARRAWLQAGRRGLGAVPALRKWNERPGQLVIVRFFCCCGARRAVDGVFQVDAFGRRRCTRRSKFSGPPLLKPSLHVNRNTAHNQSSFMKWLTRDRVVPIISANVSWLISTRIG
jgi:hypothetical protein